MLSKAVQLRCPVAPQTLHHDHLLVASCATHAYFGHDDWAAHTPGLKTLDDALAIRRRLLVAFEQVEAATHEEERQALVRLIEAGATHL